MPEGYGYDKPPGRKETMAKKTSAFTLRSGNSPLFKMIGSSPVKGKGFQKFYDKASQIGMGLLAGAKEFVTDTPVGSSISDYPGQRTVEAFKHAYKKEKKSDIEMRKKQREKNL